MRTRETCEKPLRTMWPEREGERDAREREEELLLKHMFTMAERSTRNSQKRELVVCAVRGRRHCLRSPIRPSNFRRNKTVRSSHTHKHTRAFNIIILLWPPSGWEIAEGERRAMRLRWLQSGMK